MAKVVRATPGPWNVRRWDDKHAVDGFKTAITDSRGHGIVTFCQNGENAKVRANAAIIANLPETLEALDNVTAALDTTMAFYEMKMPESDRLTRRRLICEARALLNIWRRGDDGWPQGGK